MIGENRNQKRILLAGDSILDSYHFGKVERISPEAPVPVFLETSEQYSAPGGAANVAVGIAAAGADVELFSCIGDDGRGCQLKSMLREAWVDVKSLCTVPGRITSSKLRYIGPGNHQVLRVDDEITEEISFDAVRDALEKIEGDIAEYGLFVLSDYAKGFLTEQLTKSLIALANRHGIPVLADVKGERIQKYANATLLKPNRNELCKLSGLPADSVEEAAEAAARLCREAPCSYVLATLGPDGMILADRDGLICHEKSTAREVFDVTGAGDTSLAYLAAQLVQGTELKEAVRIANAAAGIQVSRVGTGIVYPHEVAKAPGRGSGLSGEKILTYNKGQRLPVIERDRQNGKRIVFTNGCFDLLHNGHIVCLRKARRLGDVLIVGVNSDDSVQRLKGPERPFTPLKDRMEMLAALEAVDYVIPFEEDTPIDLIGAVMPDVLVKGGDYTPEAIVGAKEVKENGGEVVVIPLEKGYSTSERSALWKRSAIKN